MPDIRADSARADFLRALNVVTAHAADYGIDPDAIAMFAASGNVFTALPIAEDSSLAQLKAAVIFYGSAPVRTFRRDLPLFLVRAGLDRPPVNAAITSLASLAASQNAPVTLLNNPGGHHAFEIVDDAAATRDVIERALDFVKRATSPVYRASLRATLTEATAAAHVVNGDYAAAASIYARLVDAQPDEARLRLSYGEALLGAMRYADACAQFARLRGKGLGARDLGVPAARACAGAGDQDAALAWLESIPSRFRPRELESDSAFVALRGRPEFRALFATPE